MCRYAIHNYPEHYACFDCRVAVKGAFDQSSETQRRCGRCGGTMTAMGRDFAAPRRLAKNQWRKLEILVGEGVNFASCGCQGPGWRPRTLAEAKSWLTLRTRSGR
jgi:Ser/Thr protein kinase RdoA (MazF antagonist)